jgi:hypothetical protein
VAIDHTHGSAILTYLTIWLSLPIESGLDKPAPAHCAVARIMPSQHAMPTQLIVVGHLCVDCRMLILTPFVLPDVRR